jgi:hypothetical protein
MGTSAHFSELPIVRFHLGSAHVDATLDFHRHLFY